MTENNDFKSKIFPEGSPRVENWTIVEYGDKNANPDSAYSFLVGNVHNHPDFKDGYLVRTSKLEGFDYKSMKARTHNRVYSLGKISDIFEKTMKDNGNTLLEYNEIGKV